MRRTLFPLPTEREREREREMKKAGLANICFYIFTSSDVSKHELVSGLSRFILAIMP